MTIQNDDASSGRDLLYQRLDYLQSLNEKLVVQRLEAEAFASQMQKENDVLRGRVHELETRLGIVRELHSAIGNILIPAVALEPANTSAERSDTAERKPYFKWSKHQQALREVVKLSTADIKVKDIARAVNEQYSLDLTEQHIRYALKKFQQKATK